MTPIMLFFSCNKVKANRQQATAFSMFDEIRWWILVNLITNAYETMKTMKTMSQNKKIEVGSSSRNNSVIVTISDSRPGQVLDLRNKMFNPSHTNKDGSPVTGLNIAESIIKDHGGSFGVSESKWHGAEFRIEIPVRRETDKA